MNNDKAIDYKTEYNRLSIELSKLRLSYAELENDRDYIHSLLDAEFEKGLKLKKEIKELENNEIDKLKRANKKLNKLCIKYGCKVDRLEKENENLKQTIEKLCKAW